MKMRKFYVPYKDDKRMIYASKFLSKNGLSETVDKGSCDFVLLPVPAKKYMFKDLENNLVFYGGGDYKGIDYNKYEPFKQKNAYLTAEGAVALFKENSDTALYNADVLIVGYGRIAKALHKSLNAFASNVTVCSRSDISKIEAKSSGANCIDFNNLADRKYYDVIFNTVPKVVFGNKEIDSLDTDTLFIDLASFPGGIDSHYAKNRNIKLIDGRGLPSKYSVKSAGYLIGETVLNIIKEEFN
ncbi:MAG: NAD(P)-dependent oxidoreductase [Eubacteriales bacterium]|nr:NAD(P)-dependent oxidoreductase [Eubacteriales bacterium]